ncbi:MAG: sigma-54 dependent transcriptional regulator [candidate division KSB1 bacterium]|nr:sigma-54 dependent transcriptional regulator [candidate division KSB1 bacterium]MDZ7335545.1 sigma-54 dependent transcriptional regulator [candidate division KSB1 bacterium]MDZ7356911.1 sigma-54 dependent transcriptional regulator [candidate division KSB1 bacterium]MDZ7399258.1 sigma-54 dependent transcriptional regulator [candidate division KSB1 bacterium]
MVSSNLKVLVVDDDEAIRVSFEKFFAKSDHIAVIVENGAQALERIKSRQFDLAFVDLRLPGISGIDLLKKIRTMNPRMDIVIITGYGTVETAVEAMKFGAYDYIQKPFSLETIRHVLDKILEKRTILQNVRARRLKFDREGQVETIIGESPRMIEVYELVQKVAPTDSTVLITGETGTGKELIARAIHFHSLRRNKPFLTMDCSSLVENLFESELFGHVKGSFTGAIATKHGSFELANGGTFFFDEIGNISLNIQAKILRAIQEREIRRVGSTETIKVDVRVIAATNKDLRQAVEEGTFREDLFYRISVIPIHLPPLRERKEDIIPLANYFLEKYNQRRLKALRGFSAAVKDIFIRYHWPGNVRELENVVERAVVIEDGDEVSITSLPSHLWFDGNQQELTSPKIKSLEELEREHIIHVLKATDGNRSKTARLLGIDRKTLYDKIRRYQINDK